MSATVLKLPEPQPCHACDEKYADAVCPNCGEERPAYTALKSMTARAVQAISLLPACRYELGALCNCGRRGLCLPAA